MNFFLYVHEFCMMKEQQQKAVETRMNQKSDENKKVDRFQVLEGLIGQSKDF